MYTCRHVGFQRHLVGRGGYPTGQGRDPGAAPRRSPASRPAAMTLPTRYPAGLSNGSLGAAAHTTDLVANSPAPVEEILDSGSATRARYRRGIFALGWWRQPCHPATFSCGVTQRPVRWTTRAHCLGFQTSKNFPSIRPNSATSVVRTRHRLPNRPRRQRQRLSCFIQLAHSATKHIARDLQVRRPTVPFDVPDPVDEAFRFQ